MSLVTYKKYKDSEIEWLRDIPIHWKITRIKDFTSTQSGTTPTSGNDFYYENGIHNWIRTTDLNDSELFDVEYKVTDLAIQECRLKFLPVNTVLVAMYGGFGTIGKNSILKKESTINQSVCAILPNNRKFDHNYLFYFLKYFRDAWKIFADGTRKDPNINQDAVKNLFLYYPPINEQTQIANYLDTKTQAIDNKVELLKQKIDKYKELRKSLINQTITKGLNRNIELKESGIEWIGKIPKHWEVKRIKSFANTIKGKNIDVFETKGENRQPLLTLEYLRNESVIFESYCSSKDKVQCVKSDDLIIVWDGAAVGEIIKGKTGIISSTIAKIAFNRKIVLPEFFYFFKDNIDYKLKQIPTGMGIPHLNPNIFKNYLCTVPPLEEQKEIAQYLDTKTSLIDSIIANIENQIAGLAELRKTLINDVVTGKLKVTEDS